VQPALFCESVSLERLGASYGTPLYVYSAAMIREPIKARFLSTLFHSTRLLSRAALRKMRFTYRSQFNRQKALPWDMNS
jgi:hypothetical protein